MSKKLDEKYYKFESCDGACGRRARVRKLPISPDSGVFLCDYCWSHEMEWRRHMNMVHEPAGYGSKGPWSVYNFYQPSPDNDDVIINDELDFGDMQVSAEPIYDPKTGGFDAYALVDDDGNTLGYAKRGATPKEYVDRVKAMELSDMMTANPRLVMMRDRVGGWYTFESYGVWIVYEGDGDPTVLYGVAGEGAATLQEAVERSLIHAEAVTKCRRLKEYAVVVIPNFDMKDQPARDYATRIGSYVIKANIEAFSERSRTK